MDRRFDELDKILAGTPNNKTQKRSSALEYNEDRGKFNERASQQGQMRLNYLKKLKE